MPLDAVDLINKLLALNPRERLGYGPEGSDLDFKALKSHAFFKGINFESIAQGEEQPPIPKDLFEEATKDLKLNLED